MDGWVDGLINGSGDALLTDFFFFNVRGLVLRLWRLFFFTPPPPFFSLPHGVKIFGKPRIKKR